MSINGLSLNEVAKRRKLLIRYGLWDRFDTDSIDAWCNAFDTHNSRMIATIALDALIVRTKKSAEAAMWHFFSAVLPKITSQNDFCWKFGVVPSDILKKPKRFNIRIVRLEEPSVFGSGQSSDDMIRMLKAQFSVHEYYFSEPDDKSELIILDELSASGKQAEKAISKWVAKYDNKISVYFLAIHSKGLKRLQKKFPQVDFFFAELLGKESTLTENLINFGMAKSYSDAEKVIIDFTKKYFKNGNWTPLGYGSMCLCYRPAFTACNNLAGLYLLETKKTNVSLCNRGIG